MYSSMPCSNIKKKIIKRACLFRGLPVQLLMVFIVCLQIIDSVYPVVGFYDS